MTINVVCGSGLKAVMLAAQAVRDGDADIVVAGGQESMSLSPHVLMGSRDGQRMGDWKMVDSMITDGLWDVYNQYHMGITAENVARKYGITREQQDALALASQHKAAAAQDAGVMKQHAARPLHQRLDDDAGQFAAIALFWPRGDQADCANRRGGAKERRLWSLNHLNAFHIVNVLIRTARA
jgi:acetyl-CoA C-acetyltransferase